KKTFNAQRSTFNIHWLGVREDEPQYVGRESNGVRGKFDLKDRLLEFAVRVTKLVPAQRLRPLLIENEELIRIFSASIRTAEKKVK
ncbi:MAG: hypothetical protein DME87_09980, partial [Verrucomicrobia bacterium]